MRFDYTDHITNGLSGIVWGLDNCEFCSVVFPLSNLSDHIPDLNTHIESAQHADHMRHGGSDPSRIQNEADKYLYTAYWAYGTKLMQLAYCKQQLLKEVEGLTFQPDYLTAQ